MHWTDCNWYALRQDDTRVVGGLYYSKRFEHDAQGILFAAFFSSKPVQPERIDSKCVFHRLRLGQPGVFGEPEGYSSLPETPAALLSFALL